MVNFSPWINPYFQQVGAQYPTPHWYDLGNPYAGTYFDPNNPYAGTDQFFASSAGAPISRPQGVEQMVHPSGAPQRSMNRQSGMIQAPVTPVPYTQQPHIPSPAAPHTGIVAALMGESDPGGYNPWAVSSPVQPGPMSRDPNDPWLAEMEAILTPTPSGPMSTPVEPQAPGFSEFMAALMGGQGGGGGFGGGAGAPAPSLPPVEWPGQVPQGRVPEPADYSTAREYYDQARPQAPEASMEDMGLAILMGATGGFSPYGSVGEILGRMAGPGMAAGWAEKKEQKGDQKEYERNLQQYNQGRGQLEQGIAQAQAQEDASAAQIELQNATAVYQDTMTKYMTAREDQKWMYEQQLQQAQIGLQAANLQASLALRKMGLGIQLYSAMNKGAKGIPQTLASVVTDSLKNNMTLPGVDVNALYAEISQNIPQNIMMAGSDTVKDYMDRMVSQKLMQLAAQDPQLQEAWLEMYTPQTDMDISGIFE